MVVEEGRDDKGDVMAMDPPPQVHLILPQLLLKALEPTTSTARKAVGVPWSALALQQGCAGDQPLFVGASHAHMTPQWVFWRLVRCLIRRLGDGKGAWKKDTDRGGPGHGSPGQASPLVCWQSGSVWARWAP